MIKSGIGYSPLTEKVYMGRQNTDKRMWVGEKTDVTNDFIAVAYEYFTEGTVRAISGSESGQHLFIHIKNTKGELERLAKDIALRIKKMEPNEAKKATAAVQRKKTS